MFTAQGEVPLVVDAAAARERAVDRPQKPGGRNCCEATVLPVMTLSEIVTVAPVWNGNDPAWGMRTPPPCVTAWSGTDVLTPPVIVTSLIETVGSVAANSTPIVSTGPPPLIVVRADPAPTICTLFVTATPPANVPASSRIVSPSEAAASAACNVATQPGRLPTQIVAARAGAATNAAAARLSTSVAAKMKSVTDASVLSLESKRATSRRPNDTLDVRPEALLYLTSVSILNIGMYIAMMITPTIRPTPIIMIGSMMDVSEATDASTSSS